MFSQTVEYALRAMVHLAQVAPASCTTEQVAQTMQVPRAYLAKVLQSLGRAGLVLSQRGLGGGMTLARPATEINLFDVLQAVDPIHRIRECPLHLPQHGRQLCPLHRRLDEALASIESAFRQTTLAQVLEPGTEPSGSEEPGRAMVDALRPRAQGDGGAPQTVPGRRARRPAGSN